MADIADAKKVRIPDAARLFAQAAALRNAGERDELHTNAVKLVAGEIILGDVIEVLRTFPVHNLWLSLCYSCKKIAIWRGNRLVDPAFDMNHVPSKDMPDEVRKDYIEAARIAPASSRGSAALLRLCIERLCDHVKAEGRDLNNKIGYLVAKGLDTQIQKALDAVRVVGNNAVHPGQMSESDDPSVVETLFRLVNIVVERLISDQKKIDDVFETLPERVRRQIDKRYGVNS